MRALVITCGLIVCTSFGLADPISYQISGTASGFLYPEDPRLPGASQNPATFSNELFSFSLMADTSNVNLLGFFPDPAFSITSSAPVSAALGTDAGTLQDLNIGLLKTGSTVEFFQVNFLDVIMDLYDPAFSTFGLSSSIGPVGVTATPNPNEREDGDLVPTTFGTLIFSSLSDVTFSSTLATPEPPSAALIALAVISAVFVTRSGYKRRVSPAPGDRSAP